MILLVIDERNRLPLSHARAPSEPKASSVDQDEHYLLPLVHLATRSKYPSQKDICIEVHTVVLAGASSGGHVPSAQGQFVTYTLFHVIRTQSLFYVIPLLDVYMEFFNDIGGDPLKPSLFELIAQEQLRDLLQPALKYVLAVSFVLNSTHTIPIRTGICATLPALFDSHRKPT